MNDELTPQQIVDLKDLIKTKQWATYRLFMEDEIKSSMEMMFEGEELTEKQRDALINRRNNLKYAIEMPQLIIEKSTPRPKPKPVDNEVYATKE